MVCLLLLTLLAADPAAARELRSVRLLATSDACARLRPAPDFEAPGEPRRRLGGWRGLERAVEQERTSRTLLVDCGNFAAGSAEAAASWGRAAVRLMNILGYDAAALGSREFSWGVQNLELLARSAAFPFLADPMLDVLLNRQVPLFRPWVIRDLRGVRVALVGLSDLPADAVEGYAPGGPEEQLRRYLPSLAAEVPELTIAFGQFPADEAVRLLDSFPVLALVCCPEDGSGAEHSRLLMVPRQGQRLAQADLLVGAELLPGQVARRLINVLPADSGSAGLERLVAEFAVTGEDSAGPYLPVELSRLEVAAALAEACRLEARAEVALVPHELIASGIAAGRSTRHELRAAAPFEDRLRVVSLHDTLLHALARSEGPEVPAPMLAGAGLFVLPGGTGGWPRVRELARLRLADRGPVRRVVTTERFLTRSGLPDRGQPLPASLTRVWLDHACRLDTLHPPVLPGLVPAGPGLVPAQPLVAPLVNINTADAAALQTLPGIGPRTAERIVEYRNAHGPFRSANELGGVRGIGPITIERLRPLVTVR
ncbi:MAG: helix-hairpin-helix domain-containing protein [bacterium]